MPRLLMFLAVVVGSLVLIFGFGTRNAKQDRAEQNAVPALGAYQEGTGSEAAMTDNKETGSGTEGKDSPRSAQATARLPTFSGTVLKAQSTGASGEQEKETDRALGLLVDAGNAGVLVLPAQGPLELHFAEEIRQGTGEIKLFSFDGERFSVREKFPVEEGGDTVSVAGNQLSIRIAKPLAILTEYALQIDPGAILNTSGTPVAGLSDSPKLRFISSNGIELPSIDVDDYDNVIFGQTFTETLKLDRGDDNTLLINNVFENIDGNALELRNVANVTIYDCSFTEISGTAIRLRSSGSTDNVAIISNTFNDIGRNAISAAKRHETGVDHTRLNIVENEIGDTGYNGDTLSHAIYVQSSATNISGNSIVGTTDANAISIRGDGIVWDNYVKVTSNDRYGSGIKYFADHLSGDSRTLVIADNHIAGTDLYSGIEIKASPAAIPAEFTEEEWMVNSFVFSRNVIENVRNPYVIDRRIGGAEWSRVDILDWSSVPVFVPGAREGQSPTVRRLEAD